MVNIDLRSLAPYRPVFTSWFVPTLLLANFIYVRRRSNLSYLKVLIADVAMTALSWLLIAGVPVVPMVVWGLVLLMIGSQTDVPIVGMIPVFIISVLISTIAQSALLRCFKHRVARSEFWLLAGTNLFCLALAFYRMCVFAFAHPPIA
jgi:hypothetical protein